MTTTVADQTLTLCRRCGVPLLEDAKACVACCDVSHQLSPLETIGPFTVCSLIGSGPSGDVYLCREDETERTLTVKILHWRSLPAAAERCMRDSRLAARIHHRNLVVVRALGRARGEPFIASEYVDGPSIAQLLELESPRSPREALLIIRAAAEGLAAALAQGLLHGSVKPTNLLITRDGEVKLRDFGHTPTRGAQHTLPTDQLRYRSPEQLLGHATDHRTDIYGLGLVLHYMLTGHQPEPPRVGNNPRRLRPTRPPLVTALRSELHAALIPLVARMTAAEIGERHRSYGDLIADIDDVLRSLAIADMVRFGLDQDTGPEPEREPSASPPSSEPTQHRSPWFRQSVALTFVFAAATLSATWLGADARTALSPSLAEEMAVIPAMAATATPRTTARLSELFDYTLGGDEAARSFSRFGAISLDRVLRRRGGRLQVVPGHDWSILHDRQLDGDLDASLTFVLEPRAEVSLQLRTDDGRQVVAIIQATGPGAEPGVRLLTGDPAREVARALAPIQPRVPHIVRLQRFGEETRIRVDDRELLRTRVPLSGAYRVGLGVPLGGAELRHLRFLAEYVYPERRRS